MLFRSEKPNSRGEPAPPEVDGPDVKPQCHAFGKGALQIEDARPSGAGHCAGESDLQFRNLLRWPIDCAVIFHKNGRFDPASVVTFAVSNLFPEKISTCGADSRDLRLQCFIHTENAAANCTAQIQWENLPPWDVVHR